MDAAIDAAEGIIVVRAPKPKGRQINAAGERLIKSFEGLELAAYPDPATGGEPWTIGYGHTGPEVHPGMVIDQEQADAFFDADTDRFEAAVDRLTNGKATDNQFAAMVSLAYNVGEANFSKSTLLKRHNAGLFGAAADQFKRWNRANGMVMRGLTRRREAEAALYRRGSRE
ncbi:lysozyme [Aurantiacibacter spongiae]|uniref:Lysozyme n=2 Tax=Aurantiacibacter spongiae TaxID=2488860 RepID=A0A3N5CWA9_9SPHN|nr:lysozyme [Aurantiacibacter spongiae]